MKVCGLTWLQTHKVSISLTKVWYQSYKAFSCSTQLSLKFILLINFKMPTTVCILTFISGINAAFYDLKQENY